VEKPYGDSYIIFKNGDENNQQLEGFQQIHIIRLQMLRSKLILIAI